MSILRRGTTVAITLAVAVLVIGACSAGGGGPAASVAAPAATENDGGRGGAYGDYGASDPTSAAPPAAGESIEIGTGTGAAGTYLTGADGMTLYIFKQDSAGTSACDGDCAAKWPPLIVASGTPKAGAGVGGALTTFERADGSLQVAYKDQPLYYFASDAAPGDTNGEGVGGVWFIAAP